MSDQHPEPYDAGQPPTPYNQQHHYSPPYGHFYPPMHQVAPKSPGLALLASFFIPGLGSLMIGHVGTGIGIFIGFSVSVLFSFFLVGLPFMLGFWIWGMVDGYQGARGWNARHGIVS